MTDSDLLRLPDVEGRREISIPLARSVNTRRVILLSDVAGGLQANVNPIALVAVLTTL